MIGAASGYLQAVDLPVIDSFEELVSLVERQPGLFLRYSHGPAADAAGGPSRDYEADVDLPGLSTTTIGPEPWWPRPTADWVARRICKYAELGAEEERFPWLLAARVAGQGPDHEPIVVDVRPVARIGENALKHAEELYQNRFDVGRDSRS
jgi:hypothetical protein